VLVGAWPWGRPSSPVVAGAAILHTEVPPLATRLPDLDPKVAAAVERALAKDPAARFATMEEVVAAIDPAAGDPSPSGEAKTTARAFSGLEPSRLGRRRPSLVAGIFVIAVAVAAAVRFAGRTSSPGAAPGSGSAATAERAVSSSEEAARAYAEGMRHWRTNSIGQAMSRWARATEVDPDLAPALLRLALEGVFAERETARARYQRAARVSDRLDDRERALHAASAAMFAAAPDPKGWVAALTALSATFPRDAEIVYWRARAEEVTGAADAGRRSAEQAIALDPDFIPPYVHLWNVANQRGEDPTPLVARCAEKFPRSASCAGTLVWLAMSGADCARLDALAGDYAAAMPDHFIGDRGRAMALHARGSTREAVEELLDRAARKMPPSAVSMYTTLQAALAEAHGDFARAEPARRAEAAEAARGSESGLRALYAARHADVLVEAGREAEARTVVRDFLRREEVLEPSLAGAIGTTDGRPVLLALAARIEAASPEELERSTKRYLDTPQGAFQDFAGRATLARTKDDALLLADRPAPAHHSGAGILFGYVVYQRGRVLALAGRREEAVTTLRDALARCDRLTWALDVPRARLLLGKTLEESGDRAGARAEYEQIVRAWAAAQPRSVTAEEAARRLRGLGK
jgi:serine/threonine-protein kinase